MKNKWTWIIIGILILIIGFWIWLKSRPVSVKLPDDAPNSNDSLTQAQQTQVRSISEGLYRVLRGWSWDIFFRDPEPISQMLSLSDTLFVAVYNDFNYCYGGGKGTLRDWLEGDWWFSKSDAGTLVQEVIKRLDKLNLP